MWTIRALKHKNQTKYALIAGFLLAVPTNAALILGLSASSASIVRNTGRPGEADADRPENQESVELGEALSRAISLHWIGYEKPAPMNAPEANVEQSPAEMTPPKGAEAEAAPMPASATPAERATQGPARLASAAQVTMRDALRALMAIRAALERVEAESTDSAALQPDSAPGQEPGTVASPTGQAESAARVDTREADAFTIKQVLDASLGSPVVNQGLRIDTVRPEWTLATLMTQRPRNPVVSIAFDARGRVADAVFLDGKSTGIVAVDQPLLDAVYRWTAKGDLIDRLARERPAGVVWVQIRVMLRRE